MDLFVRESSLLRTNPLGIYPPGPIQTVLAIRDFVQNLSITKEKSGTLGIRYSQVRLYPTSTPNVTSGPSSSFWFRRWLETSPRALSLPTLSRTLNY
ncbi:hypothetical protein L873DRAFT_1798244 [Choiromyces venosus 120613-1]|uniref:Uncharacterized protein n=1 Tax=Choiromyces venosus 120613-1 TaxID=1336337 RepID=A0A3N4KHA9_9PEZI|nr:hypothetical protein L873DRAFT_1798244 [Choiromyces venosus 120613-1]